MNTENMKLLTNDGFIDIKNIIKRLWNKKISIILLSLIVAISSVFYALSLNNIYSSGALLEMNDNTSEDNSLVSNLSSQLGSLSSLAGIEVGGTFADRTLITIEMLKSKDFFHDLIILEGVLPKLTAAGEYKKDTQTILFSDEVYDEISSTWKIDKKLGSLKPSFLDSYKVYSDSFNAEQDKQTGLIIISFEHISPVFAKNFLDNIINLMNKINRERDINNATKRLKYLTSGLTNTNLSEVKFAISKLIEIEQKKLMMANLSEEYLFKVIDSPFVPEKKISPKRSLICIFITVIGVFFIILGYLIAFLIQDRRRIEN